MRSTRKLTGMVAAAGLLLAGCGGEAAESETAGGMTLDVTGVTVTGFAYRPEVITVEQGSTVEWTNDDDILHTVTSGQPQESGVPGVSEDVPGVPDGLFDMELDGTGSTASFTFDEPESVTYYCAIHAGMVGRVEVVG